MGNIIGTTTYVDFNRILYGTSKKDLSKKNKNGRLEEIESYIINDKAVIIFWKSGKKTVATVDERDTFDKEFGFCLAVFKYLIIQNNISRSSYKREIECIKEDKMKDYLLEKFNRATFENMEKSRKFLKNLKTTGKREKVTC